MALTFPSDAPVQDPFQERVASGVQITTNLTHSLPLPCQTVILDLGDVLFTWSPPRSLAIPPKIFKAILRSNTWYEYEKGTLTEDKVYEAIALGFSLTVEDVASAFQDARETLQIDPQLMQLIRDLKSEYGIRFYAMSNISAPDFNYLKGRLGDDGIKLFDYIYTSADAHERKPNVGFYRHVLKHSGVDPARTIFVDDKPENVLSGISVGMRGMVFSNPEEISRRLINFCGSPVNRAIQWIEQNKGLPSWLEIGQLVDEDFSQLLAFEVCGRRDWVCFEEPERHFNFFKGGRGVACTTLDFPCDIDTTAIGLSITSHQSAKTKHAIMDEILDHRTNDGIVKAYFDHGRPRIDPIVCINTLTLFYQYGRGEELDETLDWVLDVLQNRAYAGGTYYYATADLFLYFFSRLLDVAPALRESHGVLFTQRCKERIGAEGDALSLALRIVTLNKAGEGPSNETERLLELQDRDGGFQMGWAYKIPGAGFRLGNRLFTTVMAVKALGYHFD